MDRIAGDTLIHGSKAADWWSRQSEGFKNGMGDQLRMGLSQGESIPELVKRIFPNEVHLAEAQKEGRAQRDIIGTARRNAEALVRTSTLTVMREANMDVYAANSDVVKGVQWCATLDDRTTPLCQRLDGKVWLLPDYEPDGHNEPFPGTSAHWNCRSAILPELKSWEDLAEEAGGDTEWAKKMDEYQEGADGGAQRASKDGYVDARLSYEEWKNAVMERSGGAQSSVTPQPVDAETMKYFEEKNSTTAMAEAKKLVGYDGPIFCKDMNAAIDEIYEELNKAHGLSLKRTGDENDTAGFYFRDKAGVVPTRIIISNDITKECPSGKAPSEWLNPNYLHNGYDHYDNITTEEHFYWTVAHELAHHEYNFIPGGSHIQGHYDLMVKIMDILCPGASARPHTRLRGFDNER